MTRKVRAQHRVLGAVQTATTGHLGQSRTRRDIGEPVTAAALPFGPVRRLPAQGVRLEIDTDTRAVRIRDSA
jgi:hypothetical protein